MPHEKTGLSPEGGPMHYSVGALIKKTGRYLLIDRAIRPFGFAAIAGHVDEDETPEKALVREVKEEGDLAVTGWKLLLDEIIEDVCSHDVPVHHWYVFECEVTGEPTINAESKSMGWYTQEEIQKLNLERAWQYWFKKLGIVN